MLDNLGNCGCGILDILWRINFGKKSIIYANHCHPLIF